jgi:hypothetical protein
VVAIEARRHSVVHRSHFVPPTAPAGQDMLQGQLRLHWKLKRRFSLNHEIAENIGVNPASAPLSHRNTMEAPMPQDMIGKRALVTAAPRGIGLAMPAGWRRASTPNQLATSPLRRVFRDGSDAFSNARRRPARPSPCSRNLRRRSRRSSSPETRGKTMRPMRCMGLLHAMSENAVYGTFETDICKPRSRPRVQGG